MKYATPGQQIDALLEVAVTEEQRARDLRWNAATGQSLADATFVETFAKKCEAKAKRARNQAAKIQGLQARIAAQIAKFNGGK